MMLAGRTSPDGPPHESHPEVGPVIGDFFDGQTTARQGNGGPSRSDDLISVWASTDGLGRPVMSSTRRCSLLDGGAETTRTVIGSMIRELALQPDQRQLLIDEPELVSAPPRSRSSSAG